MQWEEKMILAIDCLRYMYFCHSKKTRIPGTEDMDKEYRNPWHHIKGAGIGTIIGAVVALLSGGMVHFI